VASKAQDDIIIIAIIATHLGRLARGTLSPFFDFLLMVWFTCASLFEFAK
jgi:hypothetical protein